MVGTEPGGERSTMVNLVFFTLRTIQGGYFSEQDSDGSQEKGEHSRQFELNLPLQKIDSNP